MKRILLLIGLLLLAGCDLLWSDQPLPEVDPGIPTAAPPTEPPPLQEITAQNAAGLAQFKSLDINYPFRLVWTRDSQSLGVIGANGINLYQAEDFRRVGYLTTFPPMFALDISPDGSTAALTMDQQSFELRDFVAGRSLHHIRPRPRFQLGFFSPDGRQLGLTSAEEVAVLIYDVLTGEEKQVARGFQTQEDIYTCSFSPDGKALLFIAGQKVQVLRLADGRLGAAINHRAAVTAAALSPDGALLATAYSPDTGDESSATLVSLWDPQSGDEIFRLAVDAAVGALTFSPDGLLLAAGSGRQIILWNVLTQVELAKLEGHENDVTALAFSPDGRILASAGADGAVRLWGVR